MSFLNPQSPFYATSPQNDFVYTNRFLADIAAQMLDHAQKLGADHAQVGISESVGLSVSVRCGDIETLEHNRDKDASITVYCGQQSGSADTSDFSEAAIAATVKAAYEIAKYTASDPFAGLADSQRLATQAKNLQLFDYWGLSTERAIEMALEMEAASFAVDPRIVNSEGASVYSQQAQSFTQTSTGFAAGDAATYHGFGCAPIAKSGKLMERDSWYDGARQVAQLADHRKVGRYAAERALSRLNPQTVITGQYPILFEAPVALGLMRAWVAAVSGGALYRGNTFLQKSIETQVFSDHISIDENPFINGANASRWFDDEGVATQARTVVNQGVLQGYFLSTYSAKKLGMQTTGNAGGAHNLHLKSATTKKTDDLVSLIRSMDRGVLITELMGDGINRVTGDYSRGASGYWVEHGVIQYPVAGITIAGNLKDMFKQIVKVGSDVFNSGAYSSGSILLEEMMVAGT